MPAIANKSVVFTETTFEGLDPVFRVWLEMSLLSLAARIGHVWPNLAAIVGAVRKARNVSQMEMGQNRAKKDNKVIFTNSDKTPARVPSDLHRDDRNHRKSGYFSLIANIEQGGRKTSIPADFVAYLAVCSGLSVLTIEAAIAEDALLSGAMAASNPVVPTNTVSVEKAVSAQKPEMSVSGSPALIVPPARHNVRSVPVSTVTDEKGETTTMTESVELPVKSGTPDMSVKSRTLSKSERAAIARKNGK